MELNKTIKNIKRWNQTKIKPLKYICFFYSKGGYNSFYEIIWSDDVLILIKDYCRSFLMSLKQWQNRKIVGKNIHIINNFHDNDDYHLYKIEHSDYVISDEKFNQIKEEIFKPYFL